VLVVGSGGREHALAWKLAQSARIDELHAAPGNPGIASLATCHPVHAEDGPAVLALARSLAADLVVVGPEAPLVAGLGDELRHAGIAVFGPSAAAARIEGSKRFAKEVMHAVSVPMAEPLAVARPPCVVKADGLAAGKGVFVCHNDAELDEALRVLSALGGRLVIEELLEGEELSVLAISDGAAVLALPIARDYKQLGDGGTGPNTGGMGSFSPVTEVSDTAVEEILELVHRPVLRELAARGSPFVGVLFAGLMLTADGPRVLEFNCRLGDPETQSILPLLEDDLLAVLSAAAAGSLGGVQLGRSDRSSVTVVLAAEDYPAGRDVGSPVDGLDDAERTGALVFHAGTALRAGGLVTSGGRILNVTAVAASLPEARSRAYAAVDRISFPGMRFRTDIGAVAEHVHG
jgi:phosphoribosylamine--glycine ligase